jgi:hypothetical protein
VSLEEDPDGHRTLSDARRIFAGGRVEQLGWPRADIRYPAGYQAPGVGQDPPDPPGGKPLTVQEETLTSVPPHVGAGDSSDPDWSYGRWMGRG